MNTVFPGRKTRPDMAKKASKIDDAESRQGQIQIGTARQGLQIPEEMRDAFVELTHAKGPSSVRFMGTIAIALLLEMPEQLRAEIFNYIRTERWENLRECSSDEIWQLFEAAMKAKWGVDDADVPGDGG